MSKWGTKWVQVSGVRLTQTTQGESIRRYLLAREFERTGCPLCNTVGGHLRDCKYFQVIWDFLRAIEKEERVNAG